MVPVIICMITHIDRAYDEVEKVPDRNWNGYSMALQFVLPLVGLVVVWNRSDFLSQLLQHLDRYGLSAICPSFSQRQKLLRWAGGRLPDTWSSRHRSLSGGISELWRDGSLMCTLINSAIPGACPNPHRHWRKPPVHAQALAYKYLGIVPIYTENDFHNDFTPEQERNLVKYLQQLQKAIDKSAIGNKVRRSVSNKFIARGMGLYTGEQHRKAIFYIYPQVLHTKVQGVLVYIRGPYGTTGKIAVPENVPVEPKIKQNQFLGNITLDFSNAVTSQIKDDIQICSEYESNRVKVAYIPRNNGIYEINLICDGELLRGSPYIVNITENLRGLKDSFSKSDSIKINSARKRIITKIIDFVDEQIVVDDESMDENRNKIIVRTPMQMDASPVCADHIVNECKNAREKRRIFAEKKAYSASDAHFSNENCAVPDADVMPLSVLNLLETLKRSSTIGRGLNNSISLPNINDCITPYQNLVKEKRDYWEKLSSCSSSAISIVNQLETGKKSRDDVTKSVDDLLAPINYEIHKKHRRYKSMDDSLEDCTIMTIGERKEMLLKKYEKDCMGLSDINVDTVNEDDKINRNNRHYTFFSSISSRIRKFDKKKSSNGKGDEDNNNNLDISKDDILKKKQLTPKHTLKHQFKRAISYFKTMEETTIRKKKI